MAGPAAADTADTARAADTAHAADTEDIAHAAHAADHGVDKTIHLLRHAKSSWDDPELPDHERPLSSRGRRAALVVGRHLKQQNASVDVVLCSTAVRARQTLDQIRDSLGRPDVRFEDGIYGADAMGLLLRLRALDDQAASVMIVGHNPAIQDLALLLVSQGEADVRRQMREKYPTAGLATVTAHVEGWGRLQPGSGRLESFTVPRSLDRS